MLTNHDTSHRKIGTQITLSMHTTSLSHQILCSRVKTRNCGGGEISPIAMLRQGFVRVTKLSMSYETTTVLSNIV